MIIYVQVISSRPFQEKNACIWFHYYRSVYGTHAPGTSKYMPGTAIYNDQNARLVMRAKSANARVRRPYTTRYY